MKKLFVIALAAFGMVACVNEEITELPQGGAITFESAFIDNATRAAIDPSITTASLAGFNVWGFVKEYDGTIFNAVDVKKVGGVWGYEGTQYWVPNQPYYFAALAPMDSANWSVEKATGDAAKLGLGTITFKNVDGSEDLLYAKEMMQSKSTVAEENGPVKFQFQHLLSKVKFTFKNGFPTETASIKVTNVKMTAPESAEINLAQADYSKAWTAHANTTTLVFGDVEKLAYTQSAEVANERLTIPAADYTYTITFDVELFMGAQSVYTVEKTSTVTGYELAMGYAYNFTAEITPENLNLEAIEFEVEEVDGWVNENMGVYTGETVGVANATELLNAIADPDVTAVVLTDDIDLGSNGITRAEGNASVVISKNFTIDGAGKTLTYGGSGRVIDIKADDSVVKNAAIKNLTINITSSYCERGINFNNANGSLLVENVTFEGTAPTYALNIPAKADGAKVTIKDSYLAGNIALNVWAENMQIDVINSELISVDNVEAENYPAISLCSDGTNVANGTVVNIEGGKVIARDEKGEPSTAFRNSTTSGEINYSGTEVVGRTKIDVAIVDYGTTQFYSFESLGDAIAKVAADNNGTVKLIRDIEMTEGVTIANGENVTIDLNGKTISGTDNATGSYGLITNKGNLTIRNGKLTLRATNNRNWNAYSSVISNTVGGKLTIEEGVVIEHLGGTDMAYGIDNLTNGKGTYAETVINGGTIKSTYRAVRQFLNGIEAQNILTVNGGVIEGANKSIWMQDPSANANTGKLTVTENAQLKGDVYLFVCAGSTEWPVEVSIAEAALVGESTILTGNVPAGYEVVLENGVYTVNHPTSVSTAEDFTKALSEGGNICLQNNLDITKLDFTNLTNDVVIDAKGKTITTHSNYGIQVKAGKNITLKNAKIEITVAGNYITYAAGLKVENGDYAGKTISLVNCEIRMCNTDWAYAVNMPASVKNLNLEIDGCTLEGALALQCWGDNNTITVTNSNLICNYTTNAMYTSYCVALQGDGTNNSENNTLNISGCAFSYSGVDNYNSTIRAVYNWSDAGNNTITVEDCTYDNKVTAY